MNLLAWGVAKSVVPNVKGDHFSHINLGSGDGRRKWEEKVEATLTENIFPPKGTYSNLSNWTGWILPHKPSSPQISMSFNKGIRLMTRLDPVGSIPFLIFFFYVWAHLPLSSFPFFPFTISLPFLSRMDLLSRSSPQRNIAGPSSENQRERSLVDYNFSLDDNISKAEEEREDKTEQVSKIGPQPIVPP